MRKTTLHKRSIAFAAIMLASPMLSAQEIIPAQLPDNLNTVGLGIFGVPDYYGSGDVQAVPVPIARYSFGDGRYIQLLGPEATMNLLPNREWRAGPVLRVRARRDDDVDDEVVGQMRHIPSATELGAFVAYHMPLDPNKPLHKLVFRADVVGNTTDVYDGATGNVSVNYSYPHPTPAFGQKMVSNIGVGMFFASSSFNRAYFGVTGSDVALFPELGGREYRPDGGVTSLKIPFSIISQLNRNWMFIAGGRYERLFEDAKDSPVVDDRGDADQWMLGAGFSYLF
jgi:MipA family protein